MYAVQGRRDIWGDEAGIESGIETSIEAERDALGTSFGMVAVRVVVVAGRNLGAKRAVLCDG